MLRLRTVSLACLLSLLACENRKSVDKPVQDASQPAEPGALRSEPEKPGSPRLFGEEQQLTELTALEDLFRRPDLYQGKTVRTDGYVRRACSKKGCWMEVSPDAAEAPERVRVTFLNYGFFVPLDAAGSWARIEGKVEVKEVPRAQVEHLEAEGAQFAQKSTDGAAQEIRLVATGVLLAEQSFPDRPAPEHPALPPFPADLTLHKPFDVPVEGDKNLRVAHAEPNQKQAIVYLHGMCGGSTAADPWVHHATAHGTFVVVRADVPCTDRPGFKWPAEPEKIEARIQKALALVQEQRGGRLDTEEVVLIGYSQGAHRAEMLARKYPEKYKRLVLGGPPTSAEPSLLKQAARIAVFGGQLEDFSHMQRGQRALQQAGIPSRYYTLPQAYHGDYGPEGPRMMKEIIDWLFEAAPTQPE